jgi:hypothetical protein
MILLNRVTRGKVRAPYRILVWGASGVGKTTLASQAPAPVFLPVEEGCNNLDVARLPQPQSWADVLASVQALTTETHDFKTLIIDTLNAAEPLVWAAVIAAANSTKIKGIEDFGYGKGYVAALDEWRLLLSMLEKLQRDRGMNLILIAHSQQKTFKNPEGDDFDVWQLAMNDKASGLIRGWCEEVLFARWEVLVNAEDKKPAKGISTGKRLMHTTENGPWQAKNRHGLPERLPLSWPVLAAYLDGLTSADLKARISCALNGLSDADTKKRAEAALVEAGDDLGRLAAIDHRLSRTANKRS